MSAYRFADVQKIMLELGTYIEPLPVLLNVDDQRVPLLGAPVHFAEVHVFPSREMLAHADLLRFGLCIVRAVVPFVTQTGTGSMLSAPVWPQIRTPSQERARADRLAAEADSGRDYATPEALSVWRSITGRAALLYLDELGAEGRARISAHLPHDMTTTGTLSRVTAELGDLSMMFETLDGIRQRVEARAAAMGHPPPRDGYRFNRVAALDFFALSQYLDMVPTYEAEMRRRDAIDFAEFERFTVRAQRIAQRNAMRAANVHAVWGGVPVPLVIEDAAPPVFTGETWDPLNPSETLDIDPADVQDYERGSEDDTEDEEEMDELSAFIFDHDHDDEDVPVPWSTVQPCPFLMVDEFDGVEIEPQTCAICLDDDPEGLAIFEGCEKHAVHRECARAMQLANFRTHAPNKCPSCRRADMITGPDAHGCEICHKGNRTVTLYTLGGGCNCGAVYCWACLPGDGVDCCRRCGATE
jgi:phage FluMu protein Com